MEDSGIGLSQEHQSRLFERFTQADSSTTRKYGGTGLGLSISKLLTELMGGEISVSSELNTGTRFTFELPLTKAKNKQKPVVGRVLSGKSILLVEDHPITMKLTANMCQLMGMTVVCADSVKEGYLASKQTAFDFALVDIQLPQQDGLLLLKKWQAEEQVQPDKVFIFTAFDSEVMREKLADFKRYPLINKPILLNDLYEKLTQTAQPPEPQALETSTVSRNDVISQQHTQDNVDTKQSDEQQNHSVSVLLVEDNDINRIVAKEMLDELPINLDIADNGQIAIDKLSEGSFELVLMDIQMPVMDGIQTTKHLRASYSPEELPIVALTANVLKEEIEYYRQIGMNDHLGKPFVRDELHSIVRKYCEC